MRQHLSCALLLSVPHAGQRRPTDFAISDVRRVLRAEIYGDDVAAIIVEPIQGEGGFIVPTKEFMQELRTSPTRSAPA